MAKRGFLKFFKFELRILFLNVSFILRTLTFPDHLIYDHLQVCMQKSVYYTLNLFTFDAIGKFFIAECWVPYVDLENVRLALEEGVVRGFKH